MHDLILMLLTLGLPLGTWFVVQTAPPTSASGAGAPAGSYTYNIVRTRNGGTPQNYTVPLTIAALNGSTQLVTTGNDSGGYFWEQTFDYQTGGIYLDELAAGNGTSDVKPSAPATALYIPANPTPGQTWNWTMTGSGGLTVSDSSSYVGTSSVAIGGTPVSAYEIKATLTTTGAINATETDDFFWAPSVNMMVQDTYTQSIPTLNINLNMQFTLASVPAGATGGTTTTTIPAGGSTSTTVAATGSTTAGGSTGSGATTSSSTAVPQAHPATATAGTTALTG